ncbi:TonB-dependent receptor, partial [Acinetobacter baumannii]
NGFTYGAGLNYVDDRFANPGNTVTLPAYTTVDAMLQYRIDKTTLQLNLYNLFDRGYIISGHGSNPNLNIPGAPRNIMLSLRQSF